MATTLQDLNQAIVTLAQTLDQMVTVVSQVAARLASDNPRDFTAQVNAINQLQSKVSTIATTLQPGSSVTPPTNPIPGT